MDEDDYYFSEDDDPTDTEENNDDQKMNYINIQYEKTNYIHTELCYILPIFNSITKTDFYNYIFFYNPKNICVTKNHKYIDEINDFYNILNKYYDINYEKIYMIYMMIIKHKKL